MQGLPVIELTGLSAADASRLVAPDVAAPVADRLVAGTQGNPLALLEVSPRLTAAQRVGAAPLPDPLPVGDRLQVVYESLLTGLSADAWRAVLLLALDRTGTAATAASALDEATERGVWSPTSRATASGTRSCATAVLRLATPAQQREAHRALADVAPRRRTVPGLAPGRGQRRDPTTTSPTSWPGWPAATGCGWATRPRRRPSNGPPLLTRDPAQAAERLAAAAEDAFVAGDLTRTRALVDRVLSSSAPTGPAAGRSSRWGCWSSTPARCPAPPTTSRPRAPCSRARRWCAR